MPKASTPHFSGTDLGRGILLGGQTRRDLTTGHLPPYLLLFWIHGTEWNDHLNPCLFFFFLISYALKKLYKILKKINIQNIETHLRNVIRVDTVSSRYKAIEPGVSLFDETGTSRDFGMQSLNPHLKRMAPGCAVGKSWSSLFVNSVFANSSTH